MKKVFIGVDDTDILNGPFGTGRVARDMAEQLEKLGLGHTFGVIRYQLLVDPRIHYTSHNSAKCVEFESEAPIILLHEICANFLKQIYLEGSDPGLCTCAEEQLSSKIISFGGSAQRELVTREKAIQLAETSGVLLSELGGTGEGIIGALAAVGLRGAGDGGRYVQLDGIRDITGLVTVGSILANTAITAVVDEDGRPVKINELIDSQDWIKPNVIAGKPVLRIRLQNTNDGSRIWETVEQKFHKNHQKKGTHHETG
jgi:hypothetical protein